VKKQPAAAPRWLRPVILALSAFALMGWFSTELSDPDTGWLLKTGQYIVQDHKLPVPDPFAYTTYMGKLAFPGEEHMRDFDLTHERLSEVVFYLVYASVGVRGAGPVPRGVAHGFLRGRRAGGVSPVEGLLSRAGRGIPGGQHRG
jgi:hypothetical protein